MPFVFVIGTINRCGEFSPPAFPGWKRGFNQHRHCPKGDALTSHSKELLLYLERESMKRTLRDLLLESLLCIFFWNIRLCPSPGRESEMRHHQV